MYEVLSLVGGATLILMDVRLTNEVLLPSAPNDRASHRRRDCIRMAALANGGFDIRFTCLDAEDKRDLIIP